MQPQPPRFPVIAASLTHHNLAYARGGALQSLRFRQNRVITVNIGNIRTKWRKWREPGFLHFGSHAGTVRLVNFP